MQVRLNRSAVEIGNFLVYAYSQKEELLSIYSILKQSLLVFRHTVASGFLSARVWDLSAAFRNRQLREHIYVPQAYTETTMAPWGSSVFYFCVWIMSKISGVSPPLLI